MKSRIVILFILAFSAGALQISCEDAPKILTDTRPLESNMWILTGQLKSETSNKPLDYMHYTPMMDGNSRELNTYIQKEIGEKEFPKDHIYFFGVEFKEQRMNDRKMLQFTFAVPEGYYSAYELFKVFLDDSDVSEKVMYGSETSYGRDKFRIYQAKYYPRQYIDPTIEHTYKVKLEIPNRPIFEKKLNVKPESNEPPPYHVVGFNEAEPKQVYVIEDETLINIGKSHDAWNYIPDYSDHRMGFGIESVEAERIRSGFSELIGDKEMPDNGLLFLFAEPEGNTTENPPRINFSFVIPSGAVKAYEIVNVKLNDRDITEKIQFSQHSTGQDRIDLCNGRIYGLDYLNPNKEHRCVISLNMENGVVYKRIVKFTVAEKQLVEIQMAGIVMIDGKNKMDELAVWLHFPDKRNPISHDLDGEFSSSFPFSTPEQGIVKRLKDPANWSLEYEDGTPAPKIIEITGSTSTIHLKLERELEKLDKTIIIKFSPVEGVYTKPCKLRI